MKHYRDEIKEKEAEAPSGRGEGSQKDEDPHWDRARHPNKTRQDVSLVNVSQSGNDTKHNCYGVACLAFGSFGSAARPIASITARRVLWQ